MRSSMTRNIKHNFSSMFQNDMKCKLKCLPEAIDSQSYLLRRPKILKELEPAELESNKVVQYSDIFGSLEQQRKPHENHGDQDQVTREGKPTSG